MKKDNSLKVYKVTAENGILLYVVAASLAETVIQVKERQVWKIKELGSVFKHDS